MHHTLSVSLSALIEIAFGVGRSARGGSVDLVDVVRSAPLFGSACVVIDDDGFRIERHGETYFAGRFAEASSLFYSPPPSLRRIAIAGPPSGSHVHPLVLAEALDEARFPADRIDRVIVGTPCGSIGFVDVTESRGSRDVTLFDAEGRLSLRLEGVRSTSIVGRRHAA